MDAMALPPAPAFESLAPAVRAKLRALASAKQLPHLVAVVAGAAKLHPPFLTRELVLKLLAHFPQPKSRERFACLEALTELPDAALPVEPTLLDHLRAHLPSLLTVLQKLEL